MKILFLALTLFFMPGTLFAADFSDPWNDKDAGFDDPWKENGSQPNDSPKEESQVSEPVQPVPKPDSGKQMNPAGMPKMPKMPGNSAISTPGMQKNTLPDSAKQLYNQKTVQNPGITPQGHAPGTDMNSVKASLMASGFSYGGKCGDGDIYFVEPALACAAVAVRGDSRGLVGAATWVSEKCYEKNPLLFNAFASFASKGKKAGGGWENNVNYNGFKACVERGGTGNPTDIPPFLGFIRPNMTREVVDALLTGKGAKATKRYNNGVEYQYLGATVFHEFCIHNGKTIRLALRVDRENPELRNLLDDMDLISPRAKYGDVLVRMETSKGVVTKVQWQNDVEEKRCGKKAI